MSNPEILAELPRMTVSKRSQLFARLAELYETNLLEGGAPSPLEKQALDEALDEFECGPGPGEPWRKVLQEISESRR